MRRDHLRTITEKGLKKAVLLDALKAKGVNVRDIVAGEATLEDVGNVAAFAASEQARTMTATALNISCGAIVD